MVRSTVPSLVEAIIIAVAGTRYRHTFVGAAVGSVIFGRVVSSGKMAVRAA